MPIYLALDCGGTSCRALAIDSSGATLFEGRGGPANIASTPAETLRESLRSSLEGVPAPDGVLACFAGLLTDEDKLFAEEALRPLIGRAHLICYPDYVAALASCPSGTNVCVLAGTGAVVCSWVGGEPRKTGAGGYLIGDIGSAFHYGREFLRHWIEDRGEVSDKANAAVQELLGSSDENGAVAALYRQAAPVQTVARFAPVLAEEAEGARDYAVQSIRSGTRGLVKTLLRHVQANHSEETDIQVGLAGGLWEVGVFRDAFVREVGRELPTVVSVVRATDPPVLGAAKLCAEMHS
ncbi:MAG TPA: BadF/BadG/BcrA/BcrD ATPase family protein [Fimbriimonadaceae bacterium]|nr:BadF/BadG/BcrA/BcrD ATPase family protein [Fimbriimonadaceae bacterium]